MEGVEKGGSNERLGPYEGGRANEDTLADASETESCEMGSDRDAVVEANAIASLVEVLVDNDHVECICWIDGNICHHEYADVLLSLV